jgi:hypothetical protein
MKTIEGNELIAEFMGLEAEQTLLGEWVYARYERVFPHSDDERTRTEFYNLRELRYHNDWNWLMEVVCQVENTEGSKGYFENGVHIVDTSGLMVSPLNIRNVWSEIVDFIEYHNQLNGI